MKRAKAALAFVLALFLMCLFCSCEAIREAALRDREKPSADAPHSETGNAAYDYRSMALDDEEMIKLFALFGIEGCDPEEFGVLKTVSINHMLNNYSADMSFDIKKPYEEVKIILMDHIKGDWEIGGDRAFIHKNEDDFFITCILDKNNEDIMFSYSAGFEVPFIKETLADRWPPVLKMPEELSKQPDLSFLYLMPEEGMLYLREWKLKDDEEADWIFELLRDSLEGYKTISSEITDGGKSVVYSIQGLSVDIECREDTLSILCNLIAKGFPLRQ